MHFDLLLHDVHLATMRGGGAPYGALRDGAVGIRGDTIAWVGARRELPRDVVAEQSRSCGGAWMTPGLVDCHTHLVYAGNRYGEFERRLEGVLSELGYAYDVVAAVLPARGGFQAEATFDRFDLKALGAAHMVAAKFRRSMSSGSWGERASSTQVYCRLSWSGFESARALE